MPGNKVAGERRKAREKLIAHLIDLAEVETEARQATLGNEGRVHVNGQHSRDDYENEAGASAWLWNQQLRRVPREHQRPKKCHSHGGSELWPRELELRYHQCLQRDNNRDQVDDKDDPTGPDTFCAIHGGRGTGDNGEHIRNWNFEAASCVGRARTAEYVHDQARIDSSNHPLQRQRQKRCNHDGHWRHAQTSRTAAPRKIANVLRGSAQRSIHFDSK